MDNSLIDPEIAPILSEKHLREPSIFTPENLLREARRQKKLSDAPVPSICVLDPDGDIVRWLRSSGRGVKDVGWACYHTDLYRTTEREVEIGVVGCAVGAAFAVLVAEELFASGCQFLISITSAGQLIDLRPPPYFILIDRALRDEGTSYHYMPAAPFSHPNAALIAPVVERLKDFPVPVELGGSWTTDAPFRETDSAVGSRRAMGLAAVEMEAAALYAFSEARDKPVLCFAHVTNQMAVAGVDFEKGEADGALDSLAVISAVANIWLTNSRPDLRRK